MDNIRDVRIGFDYGITDQLMVGIGRSKGDRFKPSVQQIKELYDFFAKYQLLQEKRQVPMSLTLFGNLVYSSMSEQNISGSEGNFSSFSERWSFSVQALLAKIITEDLSIQLTPTYIRRNWALVNDNKDLITIGAAGRWMWSDLLGLIVEYNYLLSQDYMINSTNIQNSLGIGLEINTGGHVFHVNFTNSAGIIPNTFLPYTVSTWTDGEFRFGFTISRIFNL